MATAVQRFSPDAEGRPRRINEAVAAEVRAAMARRRVTQAQLAAALGITQGPMSRRLSGHTPFDIVELVRIAELLEADLSNLVAAARADCYFTLLHGLEGQVSFDDLGWGWEPDRQFAVVS